MTAPPPVPSECICFLPPEMFPVYWRLYPSGTELPATVPKKIWESNWTRKNKSSAVKKPPDPPSLMKGYWGRLKGPALMPRSSGKRKAPEPDLPSVWPPMLCREFWDEYFQIFPNGHASPPYAPKSQDEQERSRYSLRDGNLCVNVSKDAEFPVWRASEGCDAFDADGNWIGSD